MNYTVIAQSFEDLASIRSAPAISMGEYLVSSEQTAMLRNLSIYSLRGLSRKHLRLLYMNETALEIWVEMGMKPTIIGSAHRPPSVALLALGVPFSE